MFTDRLNGCPSPSITSGHLSATALRGRGKYKKKKKEIEMGMEMDIPGCQQQINPLREDGRERSVFQALIKTKWTKSSGRSCISEMN